MPSNICIVALFLLKIVSWQFVIWILYISFIQSIITILSTVYWLMSSIPSPPLCVITGGMCPGPAIVSFGATVKASGVFLPYLVAGIAAKEAIFGHWSVYRTVLTRFTDSYSVESLNKNVPLPTHRCRNLHGVCFGIIISSTPTWI